jgi:hypothetical protein
MQSHDLVGCDIGGPVQMEFSSLVDLDDKDVEEHIPGVSLQKFSSQGQVWRVYCRTTGRVHVYFSKLEYMTHFILDLNPFVIDIKDQYPHELTVSIEQAVKLGINHIPQNAKEKVPLTTDIVVVFSGIDGAPNFTVAIYVKYIKDFVKYSIAEKLQLERESIAQTGVPLFIASEETINETMWKSIDWMATVNTEHMEGEATVEYATEIHEILQDYPDEKLTTVLNQLDQQKGVPDGYYLREFKCLLQYGLLSFELTKNVLFLECNDIELTQEVQS